MSTALDRLSPAARDHLAAFKREVEAALPGQVTRMALFGSRARGDAEEDSDYDVAVFVRDTPSDSEIRGIVSDVAFAHILDGFDISPIVLPIDVSDNATQSELAWEIARDGVVL